MGYTPPKFQRNALRMSQTVPVQLLAHEVRPVRLLGSRLLGSRPRGSPSSEVALLLEPSSTCAADATRSSCLVSRVSRQGRVERERVVDVQLYWVRHAFSCANLLEVMGKRWAGLVSMRSKLTPDPQLTDLGVRQGAPSLLSPPPPPLPPCALTAFTGTACESSLHLSTVAGADSPRDVRERVPTLT